MDPRVIAIPGFSEPVSCWSHLLGAAVVLVASRWLFARARRADALWTAVVYVIGLLFMLSMSGVYHLLEPGGTPRMVLRRLDHAAIWIQIAGTFTPIHYVLCRGAWRWGFLGLIWVLAITGLTLKTVFFASMPQALGLSLYIGMGWLGAASAWHLTRERGWRYARPLLAGGLWYTVGAVLEGIGWPTLIDGVIEAHELFHLAVLAGAFVHWRFIQTRVFAPPVGSGGPGGLAPPSGAAPASA
ncbi:MAG: hemolysin III family protein [Deltaproteobacteria bacterium]|nr:hemolysin III family protein [Deltaproteobacteria bacterium]